MRKIIFCDIDGTILDSINRPCRPSDKTIYAFNELKKNGHLIFIASGRMPCILDDEIKALNPDGFIMGNGSYCIYKDEVIFEAFINKESCEELIDYANETKGAYFLEFPSYLATADLDLPAFKMIVGDWKPIQTSNAKAEGYTKDPYIAMICYEEKEKFKLFCERFKHLNVIPHGSGYSGDINPLGINKGVGIKEVLKYFNIEKDNAYAFGDGNNDVEMFDAVKHSIAMDNASDRVKKYASEITLSVREDGFYHALVKHGLINPIE